MLEVKNNFWKIYLYRFLIGSHFIAAIMIPFFTQWGHFNYQQIMTLQAIFLLSALLSEIPTGVVADRYSRKLSLIIASGVSLLAISCYTIGPVFWYFVLGEILWGISNAFYSGADEALLYDSLKQEKREKESKKIIARAEIFFILGLLCAAPIGSLIYGYYHQLQTPIYFMYIPFSLAAIVCMFLKEPKKTGHDSETKKYLQIFKEGTKFFAGHKVLKILTIDAILVSTVAYFIIFFDQAALLKLGVDIKYFGYIKMLPFIMQILLIANISRIEKVLKRKKRLIILTGLMTGFTFIVLGTTSSVIVVIIAISLAAGFGMLRVPLFDNYYNKYIPSDKRATVISTISMMRNLAVIIVNPLVGYAADWSLTYTFIILGCIAFVFSLISHFRIKEKMLID